MEDPAMDDKYQEEPCDRGTAAQERELIKAMSQFKHLTIDPDAVPPLPSTVVMNCFGSIAIDKPSPCVQPPDAVTTNEAPAEIETSVNKQEQPPPPTPPRYTHVCTGFRCLDYDCHGNSDTQEQALAAVSSSSGIRIPVPFNPIPREFRFGGSRSAPVEKIARQTITQITTIVSAKRATSKQSDPTAELIRRLSKFKLDDRINRVEPGMVMKARARSRSLPPINRRRSINRQMPDYSRRLRMAPKSVQVTISAISDYDAMYKHYRGQHLQSSTRYRQLDSARWQSYLDQMHQCERRYARNVAFKAIQLRIDKNHEMFRRAFYPQTSIRGGGGRRRYPRRPSN